MPLGELVPPTLTVAGIPSLAPIAVAAQAPLAEAMFKHHSSVAVDPVDFAATVTRV
jgi:hypothetical protein